MSSRNEIIEKVKEKIDELVPAEADTDALQDNELSFDDLIDRQMNNRTIKMLKDLPIELLNGIGKDESLLVATKITEDIDPYFERGYIDLPDDFLRLLTFKMEGWQKTLTVHLTEDNPDYNIQINPFTRGGVRNPACVLISKDEHNKKLEYFSVLKGEPHKVEKFIYVPNTKLPTDNIADFPTHLTEPLTLCLSEEVLSIKNRHNEAAIIRAKYDEWLKQYS